jgi:hypothetical protein
LIFYTFLFLAKVMLESQGKLRYLRAKHSRSKGIFMKHPNTQKGFSAVGIAAIIATVVLISFIAWRIYDTQINKTSHQSNQTNTQTQTTTNPQTQADFFKVPELGVGFEIKGQITPVYKIVDNSGERMVVSFSTQQVIDKDAEGDCAFVDSKNDVKFSLIHIERYSSAEDAAKTALDPTAPARSTDDLTPDNNFYRVGNGIYYIPKGVIGGIPQCTQKYPDFVAQQRQLLYDSLITMKHID